MPLDIARIRAARPQNKIYFYPSVGSTMLEAAKLVSECASSGSVVLTDEQTAGIGRLARTWHSKAEEGIYCSLLLQPDLPPGELPITTLLLGLATADAIQRV